MLLIFIVLFFFVVNLSKEDYQGEDSTRKLSDKSIKKPMVLTNSRKQQEYLNYQKQQDKVFELVNKSEGELETKINALSLDDEAGARPSRMIVKRHHQPSHPTIFSFINHAEKSLFANSSSSTTPTVDPDRKTTTTVIKPNIEVKPQSIDASNYNPSEFDTTPVAAKFFVIKSYSEDDVFRSIKFNIWCSTEHGNRRLDDAFVQANNSSRKQPVYLFFSVNGSRHFCGMAQMLSRVDYSRKIDLWSQDKWRGCFQVRWIYVKDVPNLALRSIKLENNEMKPVTNSRDSQEIPFDKGIQVLNVFHSYPHTSSIFDDFDHYEANADLAIPTVVAAPSHES